jgi:hypothetical protein
MTSPNGNPATGDGGAPERSQISSNAPGNIPNSPPVQERPTYRLVLRPLPQCLDADRAMRWGLKYLLRTCALRCVSIEPIPYDPNDDLSKSINEGFAAIRERVKSGGKGWGEP